MRQKFSCCKTMKNGIEDVIKISFSIVGLLDRLIDYYEDVMRVQNECSIYGLNFFSQLSSKMSAEDSILLGLDSRPSSIINNLKATNWPLSADMAEEASDTSHPNWDSDTESFEDVNWNCHNNDVSENHHLDTSTPNANENGVIFNWNSQPSQKLIPQWNYKNHSGDTELHLELTEESDIDSDSMHELVLNKNVDHAYDYSNRVKKKCTTKKQQTEVIEENFYLSDEIIPMFQEEIDSSMTVCLIKFGNKIFPCIEVEEETCVRLMDLQTLLPYQCPVVFRSLCHDYGGDIKHCSQEQLSLLKENGSRKTNSLAVFSVDVAQRVFDYLDALFFNTNGTTLLQECYHPHILGVMHDHNYIASNSFDISNGPISVAKVNIMGYVCPVLIRYFEAFIRLIDIHKVILQDINIITLRNLCEKMGFIVKKCNKSERDLLILMGGGFDSVNVLLLKLGDAYRIIQLYLQVSSDEEESTESNDTVYENGKYYSLNSESSTDLGDIKPKKVINVPALPKTKRKFVKKKNDLNSATNLDSSLENEIGRPRQSVPPRKRKYYRKKRDCFDWLKRKKRTDDSVKKESEDSTQDEMENENSPIKSKEAVEEFASPLSNGTMMINAESKQLYNSSNEKSDQLKPNISNGSFGDIIKDKLNEHPELGTEKLQDVKSKIISISSLVNTAIKNGLGSSSSETDTKHNNRFNSSKKTSQNKKQELQDDRTTSTPIIKSEPNVPNQSTRLRNKSIWQLSGECACSSCKWERVTEIKNITYKSKLTLPRKVDDFSNFKTVSKLKANKADRTIKEKPVQKSEEKKLTPQKQKLLSVNKSQKKKPVVIRDIKKEIIDKVFFNIATDDVPDNETSEKIKNIKLETLDSLECKNNCKEETTDISANSSVNTQKSTAKDNQIINERILSNNESYTNLDSKYHYEQQIISFVDKVSGEKSQEIKICLPYGVSLKTCSVKLKNSVPIMVAQRIRSNCQHCIRQKGKLYPHLYSNRDTPCIFCKTCYRFLSVPNFLSHQHPKCHHQHQKNILELMDSDDDPDVLRTWKWFCIKKGTYESMYPTPVNAFTEDELTSDGYSSEVSNDGLMEISAEIELVHPFEFFILPMDDKDSDKRTVTLSPVKEIETQITIPDSDPNKNIFNRLESFQVLSLSTGPHLNDSKEICSDLQLGTLTPADNSISVCNNRQDETTSTTE